MHGNTVTTVISNRNTSNCCINQIISAVQPRLALSMLTCTSELAGSRLPTNRSFMRRTTSSVKQHLHSSILPATLSDVRQSSKLHPKSCPRHPSRNQAHQIVVSSTYFRFRFQPAYSSWFLDRWHLCLKRRQKRLIVLPSSATPIYRTCYLG